MGLFDKKYCSICNNKIGLLGNRKLEDGNLCKDCAAKLSPWFSERRHSTVQEISDQLRYREANKLAVQAFRMTRDYGGTTKLMIDDTAKKFMITSARDLAAANPDVLDFDQVTGCLLDIDENTSELKQKDDSGKSVSYNPPRYEYSYNFYVTVRVNHPYFDEMKFRLNNSAVNTGERSMAGVDPNWRIGTGTINRNTAAGQFYECLNMGNEIKEVVNGMIMASSAAPTPAPAAVPTEVEQAEAVLAQQAAMDQAIPDPTKDPEGFRAYYESTLKEAIAAAAASSDPNARKLAADALASLQAAGIAGAAGAAGTVAAGAANAAGPATIRCPWCGSETPADSGKCRFCDGPLN